ncbi:MAG: hypothetical protein F6K41_28505 [Symploca sp. SIO3E6]|nr:hypothetical protein [Caldora sp. SIO3E6]
MANAQYWIEKLQLDKLEEIGGYFRFHLKSEQTISQTILDEDGHERRLVMGIRQQENQATALETTRGVLNVGDSKVILRKIVFFFLRSG